MDWASGEEPTATKLNNVLQSVTHAYQTSVQTLANVTWTAITMNAEQYDPNGFHSTSSNTSRFTPTVAGEYYCHGMVAFANSTAGDRVAQFWKNGVQVDSLPFGGAAAANGTGLMGGIAFAMGTVHLNGTTDYVELMGIHSHGGNLNTDYFGVGLSHSLWVIRRIGD